MGMHGKHKRNNKLFGWISTKWNGLSRMDKIINGTIAATIGIIVVACLIFFLPEHFNNTKQEAVVNSTKVSSKKEKKADKESDKKIKSSNDDEEEDDNSTYEEETETYNNSGQKTTNDGSETQAGGSSKQQKGRRIPGEVSNGMNADYRMAAKAGLVSGNGNPDEVKHFYENMQEGENGSFSYNGATVYVERTHEGNPSGVVVNGEHYTDPDRFTITVDQ